jgi:RNA polymerase sigma-70 factor, ECF subfamily
MMSAVVHDPLRPLLDAAREGDDVAVRELVRRTQPALWRMCSALGSPGEEDDLVQETYLRALRALDAYRGDAPVQPWLLSIARRVCADHVRRRVRQRRLVDRITGVTSTGGSPALDGVSELLTVLSPERREAFVLTQVVGLSYEDAAVAAGCPIGTIRSRVARARADLLAALRASEAV